MPRKLLTEAEKSKVRAHAVAVALGIMAQGTSPTIRGVAKGINKSAMSLYTYFENKDDLIACVWAQLADDLHHALEADSNPRSAHNLQAAVVDYLTASSFARNLLVVGIKDDGDLVKMLDEWAVDHAQLFKIPFDCVAQLMLGIITSTLVGCPPPEDYFEDVALDREHLARLAA